MNREIVFERLLDNLELYFDQKRELNTKVKAAYEQGEYDVDVHYWQEYEQLEHLRELARRALDEYVTSAPIPESTDE